MTREGYIEKIIYKNEENGYAVFTVSCKDDEEVFVGTLYGVGEGLYIIAEGEYVNHPQYDIQFKFTSCEIKVPKDVVGIERYLASGIVKGIGEVLAKRIVKKFKTDTIRILEYEPERLAEISGISERKARIIASSYAEKKEFQEVIIFLSEYGVSVNLAIKIYHEYGNRVYEILKNNPYKIAEDITGVGFVVADDIARKMGIEKDSVYRLRSAIVYVLNMAVREGHIYLPKAMLIAKACSLIYTELERDIYDNSGSSSEQMEEQLMELAIEGKVIIKTIDEETVVYSNANYYLELGIARMLTDLQYRYEMPESELEAALERIESEEGIILDDIQRKAVKSAITSGVAIITGGPGTGKTTIIDAIIKYYSKQNMEIMLCAPTGRAAKRMTESTGYPSQTIHRLLEFTGAPDDTNEGGGRLHFQKNSSNPLECDVIIVDEMSMVDCFIFNALLQAIMYGTRLVLVGDVNQLPSVGAGNVLKDIINSDCFPVTTLNRIYRQEEGSDIVYNAHRINKGEHLSINNKSSDFFFIPRNGASNIIDELKVLLSDNLPKYLNINPMDIQVLAPMRKYETGVENLNIKLQSLLNPLKKGKNEIEKNGVIYRVGDKVMQMKNNYKLEWKMYSISEDGSFGNYVLEEGVGVFNGDMGIITDLNDYDEELTVMFDDGRKVIYSYEGLDELEHAFAVTIHKSQGSEYPAVVIPLLTGTKRLLNRNLLYTAITRAKRMVVIVGNIGLINQMIDNTEEQKRFTSLDIRLQELMEL